MRTLGVLERIFLVDRNFDLAAADNLEQIIGGGEKLLARGDIVVERRPGSRTAILGLQVLRMKASTWPDDEPKLANNPRGRMQSSEAGNVVLPTPS